MQRLDRPLVIADERRGAGILKQMIAEALGELAEIGLREREPVDDGGGLGVVVAAA